MNLAYASESDQPVTPSTYSSVYGSTYEIAVPVGSSVYAATYNNQPATVYDITYSYVPVVFNSLEYCHTCSDHSLTTDVNITLNSFSYNTVYNSVYSSIHDSVYGNGVLPQPRDLVISNVYLESSVIDDPTTGSASTITTRIDIEKFTYELTSKDNNKYTYSLRLDIPSISSIEQINGIRSRYRVGSVVGIFSSSYTLRLTIK
jgi:hypothetical protein